MTDDDFTSAASKDLAHYATCMMRNDIHGCIRI